MRCIPGTIGLSLGAERVGRGHYFVYEGREVKDAVQQDEAKDAAAKLVKDLHTQCCPRRVPHQHALVHVVGGLQERQGFSHVLHVMWVSDGLVWRCWVCG